MENINPKCDRCPHEDTLICDSCEDNGKDIMADKLTVILAKEERKIKYSSIANINLDTDRVKAATHYDTESCGVPGCDKLIYFTCQMSRKDYQYKITEGKKITYYCGYTHFRASEPKKKVKSKLKDKG